MLIGISLFISDFINNIILSIYTLKNNKKQNFMFYFKYILIIILVTVITNFLMNSSTKIAKTAIKILLLGFFTKLLSKDSFARSLMQVFLVSILFMIFDCLFGLVYIGILKRTLITFQNSWQGILSVNLFIAGAIAIVLLNKKLSSFIQNIANLYNSKYKVSLIGNILLCVIALWIFLERNTSGVINIYDYIMNSIVIVIITIFVIGFFKENTDKNQIKEQYDNLIDYAKTYEQEVVEKSKWQHEYQNQLIIVKSKISKNNKEAHKYIDELLLNKPSDINSQWLPKLSKFPDIGLKGLIYYKIGQMQAKGINVFVDVISDFKLSKKQCDLLKDNLQDISRMLGVYLDNAIDASTKSNKKYIILEIKLENKKIIFEISNTYKGNLNVEKMNQEKYSTKGKGHGYGLTLVKDILLKNKLLSQEREINGIYYVQKLIVNIK